MVNIKSLFFLSFLIIFPISNALSEVPAPPIKSQFFNISVGKKKVFKIKNTANIVWTNFCFDAELGCARFQTKSESKTEPEKKDLTKKNIFGFFKIVSNRIEKKDFNTYCQKVFDAGKSINPNWKNLAINSKTSLPQCSWQGANQLNHLFWKDGITISTTTSMNFDIKNIISEIKLNEKS